MARRNSTGSFGGLYGGDARGLYSSGSHRNMMIYGKPPRRWPKVLLAIVVILIVVACVWQFACGGLPFLGAQEGQDQGQSEQQATVQQQSASASEAVASSGDSSEHGTYQAGLNTQIQVSALGDCTLGADPDFDDSTSLPGVYDEQGAKYFFKLVKKFTKADNLTLANLEGPLTTSTDVQEKSFNFKGDPSYANILKQGSVEAVDLANDHAYDYGTTGYEDTKTSLAKYKITNFGYDRTATVEVNGIKVGLYGINQLTGDDVAEQQMQQDVASLKQQGCALIIGMFHWGTEGTHKVADDQVSLAHDAIDQGTDLVIGAHPHLLQGIERYKNHYICYSMGNFVYGGNDHPKDMNTMIFQQTFTFQDGMLVLDDSTAKNADVVPCTISSSTSQNNYQPRPLMGDSATELLEKINGYSGKLSGEAAELETSLNDYSCAQMR